MSLRSELTPAFGGTTDITGFAAGSTWSRMTQLRHWLVSAPLTALEIDPNSPVAYGNKGIVLITAGRAREAFSSPQIALRLSPKDPAASTWHFFLCHAHVHLQQYSEAIEECRRLINLNKLDWLSYVDLISAYGATGQSEMAQQMLAELNAIRPDFTVQWFQQVGYAPSSNPQFRREYDDIVDGLRKAGVREH